MKRNITVKEKDLIDTLNANIGARKEDTVKEPYVEPKCGTIDDDPIKDTHMEGSTERRTYKSGQGPEIIEDCTTLSPRDINGDIIDIDGFDDNPEDRAESRASNKWANGSLNFVKAVEMERERLSKNAAYVAALKKVLGLDGGTQPRTHSEDGYEEVNHPQHYNNYDVEVIDMMERVFGKEETAVFCKLNAFKYRMRAGTKPGQDAAKDLDKERWYLNKARELGQK